MIGRQVSFGRGSVLPINLKVGRVVLGPPKTAHTWLDFSYDCGCLFESDYMELSGRCTETGAMLGEMIKRPDSFLIKHL